MEMRIKRNCIRVLNLVVINIEVVVEVQERIVCIIVIK